MLDQSFFGGFFPHLEPDEAGSTAFSDVEWTDDPHLRSYNVEAPSYFPDYFMRTGWEVAPEPEPPITPAVRTGGGGIYRGWEGWKEKKKHKTSKSLVKAVSTALRKKEWVVPGVFINTGALDSLPSRAIVPLIEAIYRAAGGAPISRIAIDCAERLQAILNEEEEDFLIYLLLEEM